MMPIRALPLLFLFIVFGCTKNDVDEGIVIPEVIDIG